MGKQHQLQTLQHVPPHNTSPKLSEDQAALQGPKIQVLNLKLQHGQYLVRQLEQCDQVEGLLSLRIVTSIFLIMSKMTKLIEKVNKKESESKLHIHDTVFPALSIPRIRT
nr:hypothetical protein Iba_chr06aCG6940 [Ipomoea batatas]